MELSERKPNRLTEYNCSLNGAYFVTLCIQNREHLLWKNVGAIIDRPENVPLSGLGRIVRQSIDKHYPAVTVDRFTIMPDRVHLLLQILRRAIIDRPYDLHGSAADERCSYQGSRLSLMAKGLL